ncbi:MAG: ribosome silencing factor [Bacteroidetes bacterium]|nr:ribosome silencing factor [Bacteroidota bacterium]
MTLSPKKSTPAVDEILAPKRTKEKKRQTATPTKQLARLAVDAILDKKGKNILVMNVTGISGVADIFILVTGDSDLQIRAIAESVRMKIKETVGERPWHVEGTDHHHWVLLDYVDLVVHVFLAEKREFYGLERLWGDAPREEVLDNQQASDVKLLAD